MDQPEFSWTAPDLAAFEVMALSARDALPEPYMQAAQQVALRVEDFATDKMLKEVGLEDPFQLTGLYDGIPLTEKSTLDQPTQPDAIWLFRRPILDE